MSEQDEQEYFFHYIPGVGILGVRKELLSCFSRRELVEALWLETGKIIGDPGYYEFHRRVHEHMAHDPNFSEEATK